MKRCLNHGGRVSISVRFVLWGYSVCYYRYQLVHHDVVKFWSFILFYLQFLSDVVHITAGFQADVDQHRHAKANAEIMSANEARKIVEEKIVALETRATEAIGDATKLEVTNKSLSEKVLELVRKFDEMGLSRDEETKKVIIFGSRKCWTKEEEIELLVKENDRLNIKVHSGIEDIAKALRDRYPEVMSMCRGSTLGSICQATPFSIALLITLPNCRILCRLRSRYRMLEGGRCPVRNIYIFKLLRWTLFERCLIWLWHSELVSHFFLFNCYYFGNNSFLWLIFCGDSINYGLSVNFIFLLIGVFCLIFVFYLSDLVKMFVTWKHNSCVVLFMLYTL